MVGKTGALLKAEEARALTENVVENKRKSQLNEVIYGIRKAVSDGKFSNRWHSSRINQYCKTELEALGYNVEKTDDGYWEVSW